MRDAYAQVFVHIVWSTWDRQPVLTPEIRRAIYACIKRECDDLKAGVIALGGTEDHVHLFVSLPTAVSVASLVKQVKGSSSHLVNHTLAYDGSFKWQGSYAAFSVSRSLGPTIRAYIADQEVHHREGTTDKDAEIAWESESA